MTDFWSDKSDKETVQKQVDLDLLKTRRAKDSEKYQNLAKTVTIFVYYLRVSIDFQIQNSKLHSTLRNTFR